MPESNIQRISVFIQGRVQGVGFRYFVSDQASRLGLVGWTRNRLDRSVEVIAEGDTRALEQFLAELQRGPRASEVTLVDHSPGTATGEFDRFTIEKTC
jgi:acylphosphatase